MVIIMKKRTIIAIGILIFVIIGIMMYENISKEIMKRIADITPGYECEENKPCITCIFKGELCDCKEEICYCGDYVVNRSVCKPI